MPTKPDGDSGKSLPARGKLVRDRIPEILQAKGVRHSTLVLEDDDEYVDALVSKVLEEAKELRKDPSSEELADTIEAIEALKPFFPDLEKVREAKLQAKGGFAKRILLVDIE